MSYIIKLNNKFNSNIAYYKPGFIYTSEIKDAYRFEHEEDALACIICYISSITWDVEVVEYERQLGTYFSTYNHNSSIQEIKDILLLPIYIPKIIYYMIKNNIRRIKNNN